MDMQWLLSFIVSVLSLFYPRQQPRGIKASSTASGNWSAVQALDRQAPGSRYGGPSVHGLDAVWISRLTPDEIPEFDAPPPDLAWQLSWSGGNGTCQGAIDARRPEIQRFAAKYKVALGCYYDDRTRDIKDDALYVSSTYDITQTPMSMGLTYPPIFPGPHGIREFVVLFVPSGISVSQFHTLREARGLGVKIKRLGAQAL
jgi:hypothetical protein